MKNVDYQIDSYALNSLSERIGVNILPFKKQMCFTTIGSQICRIVYSNEFAAVYVQDSLKPKLINFLSEINLESAIQNPQFYKIILTALGYSIDSFILEPSDEYVEKKQYNCRHTLEFVCNKACYIPY